MHLQFNQYKSLIYFMQHQGYKNKPNFLLALLRNLFFLERSLSFIQTAEQLDKLILFCFKTIPTYAQRCISIKISRFCSQGNRNLFFQIFCHPPLNVIVKGKKNSRHHHIWMFLSIPFWYYCFAYLVEFYW